MQPLHDNSITFEERLNILNLLSFRASINFIVKILKGLFFTNLSTTINEHRHVQRRVSYFARTNSIPINSPLRIVMTNVNVYRKDFNLENSININWRCKFLTSADVTETNTSISINANIIKQKSKLLLPRSIDQML